MASQVRLLSPHYPVFEKESHELGNNRKKYSYSHRHNIRRSSCHLPRVAASGFASVSVSTER